MQLNYLLIIIISISLFIFIENQYAFSESDYMVNIIDFSGKPASSAVNENTNVVYVNDFLGKLVVINGTNDKVIENINVTKTSFGIGYNHATNLIYVGGELTNIVNVVNASSKEIVANIPIPDPYDIAIDSEKNKIYITSDKINTVFAINGSSNEIISKFDVNKPCGIAVNSQTGMVYVTSETDNTVHVFDGDGKKVSIINVETSPRGVAVNPITNMIYVTNQETNAISVIDGEQNIVTNSIPVGKIPRKVAVHYDTNLIYVTNQGSRDISVINGENNSVIKTIPVQEPFEIAINQNTGKIYSMYFGKTGVAVIEKTDAREFPELGIKVETIAENLNIPWEIDFAPDGRIFFTERNGNLRLIENKLVSEPIISLKVSGSEGGLLGLALDPNFEENHYLYLYYSYSDFFDIYNRVVRYVEFDNKLSDKMILLDKIPGGQIHDGGRIKFGPDGKLYITTGDAGNSKMAQNLDSLAGKILRINSDGTLPKDNPFPNSSVYSLGHRNPQGIDWHPDSGILVATEHGPSGERGVAHDEVNVIFSGKNYGWPDIVGDETREGMVNPILHTGEDTWAPSGSVFYDSDKISEWYGKYFIATLRGNLRVLDLDLNNNKVISSEELFVGEYGRLRDINIGPDGNLYILTSNQDGRGEPVQNDDRILRISPLKFNVEKGDSSLSPLKQVQLGTLPQNVSCKKGFELVIKASNEIHACVKISSVQKLIEIGWAQDIQS